MRGKKIVLIGDIRDFEHSMLLYIWHSVLMALIKISICHVTEKLWALVTNVFRIGEFWNNQMHWNYWHNYSTSYEVLDKSFHFNPIYATTVFVWKSFTCRIIELRQPCSNQVEIVSVIEERILRFGISWWSGFKEEWYRMFHEFRISFSMAELLSNFFLTS